MELLSSQNLLKRSKRNVLQRCADMRFASSGEVVHLCAAHDSSAQRVCSQAANNQIATCQAVVSVKISQLDTFSRSGGCQNLAGNMSIDRNILQRRLIPGCLIVELPRERDVSLCLRRGIHL